MFRRAVPALLAFGMGACTPELNWRELGTPESGVRQLFPCKAVRQQRQVEMAGRRRTMVLYVCDAGSASWAQASMEVDGPDDALRTREHLWAAASANLGASAPASASEPDQRRWLSGQSPDGRPLQAAHRVIGFTRRVVQITVIGPYLKPDDVESFLGSVRSGS